MYDTSVFSFCSQILINPGKYQHLEEYYEQWTGDVVNKNSEYFQRVDVSS